jgi:hypothetical protein
MRMGAEKALRAAIELFHMLHACAEPLPSGTASGNLLH